MQKRDIKINLACYLIRFRKKSARRGDYLPLNSVLSNGFLNFMKEFIDYVSIETHESIDKERIFDLEHVDPSNLSSGIISGFFSKGLRGKGTKIKKKKGRKAIIVDEIDPSKFTSDFYFFLFGIPLTIPETKAGVFMAQSYKNYGYKEIFEEAFKKFVSIKLGESITGEISILTNPVLFKRTLKESGFKKLRYRKHSLPKYLDNVIDNKINNDKDRKYYDIELVISAKRQIAGVDINKKLERVVDENTSFLELAPIDGFDFDEVYADVVVGKYRRTVNISNPNRFGAVYDISKNVTFEEDGQPKFDSIKKIATDILVDDILNNVDFQ